MIPLGNVVVGALAAALGVYPALVVMTVVGIGAALAVLSVPAVRHLPRGTAPSSGTVGGLA
jgi:hypothetical protein